MTLDAGHYLRCVDSYAQMTSAWHAGTWDGFTAGGNLRTLVHLHLVNFGVWHHEDEARREDATIAAIARHKAATDMLNSRRNALIEQIDYDVLADLPDAPHARCVTETVGCLVDRLSVAALRADHLSRALAAGHGHPPDRLAVVREQASDLRRSLSSLLDELACGQVRFKVYRQFKTPQPSAACGLSPEWLRAMLDAVRSPDRSRQSLEERA